MERLSSASTIVLIHGMKNRFEFLDACEKLRACFNDEYDTPDFKGWYAKLMRAKESLGHYGCFVLAFIGEGGGLFGIDKDLNNLIVRARSKNATIHKFRYPNISLSDIMRLEPSALKKVHEDFGKEGIIF